MTWWRGRSKLAKLGIVSLAIVAMSIAAFAVLRPVKVLPRIQPLPPFDLVDQNGRYVGYPELLGKISVVSFFPTKADSATKLIEDLKNFRQQLLTEDKENDFPVQWITITLDPEHDTPQVLSDFARRENLATFEDWFFLTGSPLAVKLAVGTGFGVFYDQPAQPGGDLVFDRTLVLVDERGIIRAKYALDRMDWDVVLRDTQLLRKEASSDGAMRAAYEAAHLFLCYPR